MPAATTRTAVTTGLLRPLKPPGTATVTCDAVGRRSCFSKIAGQAVVCWVRIGIAVAASPRLHPKLAMSVVKHGRPRPHRARACEPPRLSPSPAGYVVRPPPLAPSRPAFAPCDTEKVRTLVPALRSKPPAHAPEAACLVSRLAPATHEQFPLPLPARWFAVLDSFDHFIIFGPFRPASASVSACNQRRVHLPAAARVHTGEQHVLRHGLLIFSAWGAPNRLPRSQSTAASPVSSGFFTIEVPIHIVHKQCNRVTLPASVPHSGLAEAWGWVHNVVVAGPWSVSTPLRTSPTVRILAGLSPIANLADISVAGVDRTIATEGITPQVTTAAYSIQQFTSSSRSTHLGEYRHACTARLEKVSRTTRTYQAACIPPSHHADNKNQGLHSTVLLTSNGKY